MFTAKMFPSKTSCNGQKWTNEARDDGVWVSVTQTDDGSTFVISARNLFEEHTLYENPRAEFVMQFLADNFQ